MNGSLSYDPQTNDNTGINFTWYYGKIKGQSNASLQLLVQGSFSAFNSSKIQDLRKDSGPVITIDANFAHYNETIIVNLTVAKGYRVSSVLQVVHLVRGDPPKISQR